MLRSLHTCVLRIYLSISYLSNVFSLYDPFIMYFVPFSTKCFIKTKRKESAKVNGRSLRCSVRLLCAASRNRCRERGVYRGHVGDNCVIITKEKKEGNMKKDLHFKATCPFPLGWWVKRGQKSSS